MNITGLSTGFARLDEKIMGLKPGEITVIASRPSVGKTALAMNIVECVALGQDINGDTAKYDGGKQHPVLFFSLEMPANALINRSARVDLWRTGNDAGEVIRYAQIFIEDDESALDVSVIRDKARKAKRLHNIELIVIDYLQLIENRGVAANSRVEELASIVAEIKELAVELSIPVILLAQLRASIASGVDKKLTFLDFRDLLALEELTDIVMFLQRPHCVNGEVNKDGEMVFVDIAKNRHGETGEVSLVLPHEARCKQQRRKVR